jgi:hypothetical protein
VKKLKCLRCKHREELPGTAHIRCNHPENALILSDPLAKMMAILASVGRMVPFLIRTKLSIEYDPYGFKMGWFNWPFIFDPVWLEDCDGFEAVREER